MGTSRIGAVSPWGGELTGGGCAGESCIGGLYGGVESVGGLDVEGVHQPQIGAESQVAAELTRALVRAGRADEALDLAALARESAPAESVTAHALWRTSQALVSATRGEHEEAERMAREASELVPDDMLTLRANVLVDFSEVLARSGRHTESVEVADEALRLFELKGNVSGAEIARSLLKPQ